MNFRSKFMHALLGILLPLPATLAAAQAPAAQLPCAYTGTVLRDGAGKPVRFDSEAMKKRATHKEELSGIFRMVDGRAAVLVDVLVGSDGKVICSRSLTSPNIFSSGTQKALAGWRFEPATDGRKAVAYLGRMEFFLCNSSCGERQWSMSLLE